MRLSEKNKIILPILLIAVFVFSTFGWIYWFQNHQMRRIIQAERLLDQISEGMHEINRTIQSGILTLEEEYAVQSARHSLRVFEALTALEKMHPEDAAAVRSMFLEHYVKIVSINSLFLEKRLDEGRTRLSDLDTGFSKMNQAMKKMIDLRINEYKKAVQNINLFMAVTSVIFSAVLLFIVRLFIYYGKKREVAEKALIESEKMASLGILSGGVAHEIRNPLTIILHGADHLESLLSPDSREHRIINRIREAVLRAEGIIKGLLSFSQGPAQGREEQNVLSVLEESLLMLGQHADLRNILIEKEFPSHALMLRSDAARLRQAFLNFLMNAVEAMPEGGILKIICRNTNPAFFSITFIDNGEGIPQNEIGKVFDPFYSTKQKFGNVGLGLSIARGIIEGYGGTLKIESTAGHGTNIAIVFPK